MDDFKGLWINVNDRLPESQERRWSEDVIALGDSGDVFKLACQGGILAAYSSIY